MLAGCAVASDAVLHDVPDGIVQHNYAGSPGDHEEPAHMQKELDAAFEQAMSEIDSMASSPPSGRHRFGDIRAISQAQPFLRVVADALGRQQDEEPDPQPLPTASPPTTTSHLGLRPPQPADTSLEGLSMLEREVVNQQRPLTLSFPSCPRTHSLSVRR